MDNAALITGSAKRIGKELALALAKSGVDLVIHYHKSKKEAEDLQEQIRKLNVKCELISGDLNQNCFESLIKEALEKMPHLNILINNASIFEPTPFLTTTEDQLKRHLNINFIAPFFLTQNFAKIVKSGLVINFLDSKIKKTSKNYFSYLLSKKALADFTKMAAIELGPKIRVNSIAPGITEFSLDIDDKNYLEKIVNNLPLKRIAKSSDIINAVKILIENEYLTGQIIFVDGGESL